MRTSASARFFVTRPWSIYIQRINYKCAPGGGLQRRLTEPTTQPPSLQLSAALSTSPRSLANMLKQTLVAAYFVKVSR